MAAKVFDLENWLTAEMFYENDLIFKDTLGDSLFENVSKSVADLKQTKFTLDSFRVVVTANDRTSHGRRIFSR